MNRPTITDVAKVAGVSKATVSRVLNGSAAHMRPETAAKVKDAVAALEFRRNAVARSLSVRHSGTLALVVSDIVNPFYAKVMQGLEDAALARGANVFLGNTNYDLNRGLALIDSLIDKQVDGVLLMSSSMEPSWLERLRRSQVPTVVVDPVSHAGQPGVAAIRVDFAAGIGKAVASLYGAGHRKVAVVTGPLELKTARVRRDAVLGAVTTCGFEPDTVVQIEGDFRTGGGRRALEPILNGEVTAVFCCNDLMGMGLLLEARKHNLDLPQDLSVIGLDDIEMAAETYPALSSVALPRYAIGELAAELIFELMVNPQAEKLERCVKTTYIARESVSSPQRAVLKEKR